MTQTDMNELAKTCQMYARTETVNQYTYVCALAPKVSEVTQWLQANDSLYLTLCADTLVVDQDAVWPVAVGAQIVARHIEVQSREATLRLSTGDKDTGMVICAGRISGQLSVGWEGGKSTPLVWDNTAPCLFSWQKSGAPQQQTAGARDLADNLKTWAARNALRAGFCAGAQLVYDTATAATSQEMLQWVADGCTAILDQTAEATAPQDVGPDMNALLQQTTALLVYAKAAAAGLVMVPLLSETYYADRIQALMTVAQGYQDKVDQIDQQEHIDRVLAEFAESLAQVTTNSEQPLQSELTAYQDSYRRLYDNYLVLLGSFKVQQDQVDKARDALDKAIKKAEIKEKISAVFSLVSSAIDMTKAVAEFGAENYPAAAGDAFSSFQSFVDALDKFDDHAFQDLKDAADGLKADMGGLSAVGINAYTVWETVVYKDGTVSFQTAERFARSLSDASVGGDPQLGWEIFDQKVSTTLDAVVSGGGAVSSQAAAYEAALKTQALYGKAIMDKIVALVRLAYQLADTAGRLLAVQNNVAVWQNLQETITDEEQRLQAQEAFVRERYMDIKRSLVVALENFRAAYAYFFLTQCPTRISLDMDYATLTDALSGVSGAVGDMLNPASPPLQQFEDSRWSVDVDGTNVAFDANNSVTWSIDITDRAFVEGLTPSHSKAVYLDQVEFLLHPEPPAGTKVQMTVNVSGVYQLDSPNGEEHFRFVCEQPFNLDAQYVMEKRGPRYTIAWAPADEVSAYYMKPAPFTQWTLTLVNPETGTGIDRIDLRLNGVYWRSSVWAKQI